MHTSLVASAERCLVERPETMKLEDFMANLVADEILICKNYAAFTGTGGAPGEKASICIINKCLGAVLDNYLRCAVAH